jgi:hypothetical protein
MMTELAELRVELADFVETLSILNEVITLALDQFPNEPQEVWQRQVYWLFSEIAGDLDAHRDFLTGKVFALERLHAANPRGSAS